MAAPLPSPRGGVWRLVVRLAVLVTSAATVVVLAGGTAMWLAERRTPEGTVRSWGDAIWVTVSTMTTVGYGDHVPTSTAGRFIAAGVMLVGVGIVGAVAAVVALAVARQAAQEEERFLEAEAETLEQRLEVRLDALEAQLAAIDDRLRKGFAGPAGSAGAQGTLEDR